MLNVEFLKRVPKTRFRVTRRNEYFLTTSFLIYIFIILFCALFVKKECLKLTSFKSYSMYLWKGDFKNLLIKR